MPKSRSPWQQAQALAEQTPDSRNRSVDFLRAISIFVVVIGHWIMSSPWWEADSDHMGHILTWAPWTHWLTWGLQVMPIFFFVGGYSNGITWDAAQRDGLSYATWISARLNRLLRPVLILISFWTVVGIGATLAGVPSIYLRIASQVAFVPTWFLAVYAIMVLFAPLMRNAWKRWGLGSIVLPLFLTVVGDLAFFWSDWTALCWWNYVSLWIIVHQLGFVWLDRRISGNTIPWLLLALGLGVLYGLTEWGPWPRSLVGVPGEAISNSTPPRLPLLALAAAQFGLVLLIEKPLSKWLARGNTWTAVVLLSGLIMTVFLWHSSVMMLSYGVGFLFDGLGLHTIPGADGWWLTHWVWIGVFLMVLAAIVPFLARFERLSKTSGTPPGAIRQVVGTLVFAFGLTLLALDGIDDANPLGIRYGVILWTFAGAFLLGLGPKRKAKSK